MSTQNIFYPIADDVDELNAVNNFIRSNMHPGYVNMEIKWGCKNKELAIIKCGVIEMSMAYLDLVTPVTLFKILSSLENPTCINANGRYVTDETGLITLIPNGY